jgi:imidazolonepropionase-like amidohydrolase
LQVLISATGVVEDAYMTSEANSAAKPGQESVVLASFDSYRHAEHMLASLGRGFRKKARKGGGTTAVVVRGNPDGSLKLTESRVLSGSGANHVKVTFRS